MAHKVRNLVFVSAGTQGIDLLWSPFYGVMMTHRTHRHACGNDICCYDEYGNKCKNVVWIHVTPIYRNVNYRVCSYYSYDGRSIRS